MVCLWIWIEQLGCVIGLELLARGNPWSTACKQGMEAGGPVDTHKVSDVIVEVQLVLPTTVNF